MHPRPSLVLIAPALITAAVSVCTAASEPPPPAPLSTPNEVLDRLKDVREQLRAIEELEQRRRLLRSATPGKETKDAEEQLSREIELRRQDADKKAKEAAVEASKVFGAPAEGLGGFGFGLGYGAIALRGTGDVRAAVIDNGTVRVTEQERQKLGVWLSTSWACDRCGFGAKTSIGFGPFLAVQLGGNESTVSSVAAGIGFSFRNRRGHDGKAQFPLDVQIGYAQTKAKQLADGYRDGEAPPAGATQALLKSVTKGGPLLLVSYNF
jgi:hypothetical protein